MFYAIILLALYLLPSSVAVQRGHRNALAIFVTNLFFGWTFLGWVGSLIWACTSNTKKRMEKDARLLRAQRLNLYQSVDGRLMPDQGEDEDEYEYRQRLQRIKRIDRLPQ